MIVIIGTLKFNDVAQVPSGYVTKVTCSEVFLAGREPAKVAETNFQNISPTFDWVSIDVDVSAQTVRGHFLGFGRTLAVFDQDHGCRLDPGTGLISVSRLPSAPFSEQNSLRVQNFKADVQAAVLKLFDDSASEHPIVTRGAIVVQNGDIVAEYYADGFSESTRQQSWSVSKGVLQALIGISIKQGLIDLEETNLLTEWPRSDPRAKISINHLLQMSSGLEFGEDYANPLSDVDQMLFNSSDMGTFAANQLLTHEPGTRVQYSSGTTNILSLILKRRLTQSRLNYHAYPYEELFWPIGMNSAVFEVDPSGTFIGSSYVYATPRDFARFGELYLNDGKWNGVQILPENWVDYTNMPASGINQQYGAHWSLNQDGSNLPGLPEDIYYLGGNDGQFIFVIPSKNAVIVRLGVMRFPATFEQDLLPRIVAIYDSL